MSRADRIQRLKKETGVGKKLEWCPLPGWAFGSDVDILLSVGPHGDDIRLAANVTRAEYVAALRVCVEARELNRQYLEPDWQERSWQRFLAWRSGDQWPVAEQQAPPPRPTVSVVEEVWPKDKGPRQRRDQVREDERELERQRLLRIANEAGVRYFT